MEKGFTNRAAVNKFAITGPESTGKSTLTMQLAELYKTNWVREYAREFLMRSNGTYSEPDLLAISKGQRMLEQEAMKYSSPMLFCDTELIVLKIWSLVKFGRCHPLILQWIEHQKYTHYFLCNIDIPWQEDPLREHPHFREELFEMYKNELEFYCFPYTVISGSETERLISAKNIVDKCNFGKQ